MSLAASPEEIVYVVDDDEAVRDSLGLLLEANGFRVRAFDSAESFIAMLRIRRGAAPVACLVLDVRMPGMSGIELHEELLKTGNDIPLVFITGHGDVPMAVASMKKGAADFLEKPFNDAQLCALVRKCLEQAGQRLRGDIDDREAARRIARLTTRERQVLELIVAGRLNKQVADDLAISIKTVEVHRANIMEKLEARAMADLMRIALRRSGG